MEVVQEPIEQNILKHEMVLVVVLQNAQRVKYYYNITLAINLFSCQSLKKNV